LVTFSLTIVSKNSHLNTLNQKHLAQNSQHSYYNNPSGQNRQKKTVRRSAFFRVSYNFM